MKYFKQNCKKCNFILLMMLRNNENLVLFVDVATDCRRYFIGILLETELAF